MNTWFFSEFIINLIGIVIILFLFYWSYNSKVLDIWGSFIAAVFGLIVWYFSGPFFFFILLCYYLLSNLATRFQYKKKRTMEISESGRNLENVVSNGLVPVFASVFGLEFVFFGALAAALADTLSSEIGSLSKSNPLLLTTFESVLPGRNGAVSSLGLLFSFVGGLVIGFLIILLPIPTTNPYLLLLILSISGFIGSLFDSFLGATLEANGELSNGSVNFIATLLAGLIAFLIIGFLG